VTHPYESSSLTLDHDARPVFLDFILLIGNLIPN